MIRFIKIENGIKYLITNYKMVDGVLVVKQVGCWKWELERTPRPAST